jgi:hypothetical protein
MSVETMQKVGSMTATFSVQRENKPKYAKSTYVPPHQRNSTVSKFENNKNGGKKHTEYTQSYKLRVLSLFNLFHAKHFTFLRGKVFRGSRRVK